VLLWVYDPTAVSRGAERIWPVVYDCVDDYPEQTYGARRRTLMAQSDDAVARAATVVFATTPTLVERQQGRNSSTYHVPNVGDYEHFALAAEHGSAAPEVAGLPHPVIGFSGNFLAGKVDLALLKALVEARPAWTFLLVGPAQAGTEASLAELAGAQNVVWVGQKPYAELPGYVAAFDVGLIPYLSNAYTQSCFPLKLYEYLAAGKPVVATGLPSLAGLPEVALADASASEVIGAIEDALGRSGDEYRSRRMAIASQNTWESRVGTLLERVGSEVARP
jgi:glycosyltransferase involved in cell wall biosynthesis